MRVARVATCSLNQWAMDFEGNLERIRESIRTARREGATYRLGPELEVCGYGCEDHFYERDTFAHAWEAVAALVESGDTDDVLVDLGVPVLFRDVPYNCRVLLLNRRVLLIRPKQALADDGNYRESRWFRAWQTGVRGAGGGVLEEYLLPACMQRACRDGQRTCPIGDAIVQCADASVACETCEELFTLEAPHIRYALSGCEIIANGSGSHHNLRKLDRRVELLRSATAKGGGAYLYANQIGCDGGRLYYDGCALISVNGDIVAQGAQFSIEKEVEVVVGVVDLDDVVSYRAAIASRGVQAAATPAVPRVLVPAEWSFRICAPVEVARVLAPSPAVQVRYHAPEEEIALGPACWMWDYLRRSGLGGFFLPLSGGADSSSTAALVGNMCQLVARAAREKNERVIREARRVVGKEPHASAYVPSDAREFASRILHTAYLGSSNSSADTRKRAAELADELGAYHLNVHIDVVVKAVTSLFAAVTGRVPAFKAHGGSHAENLALQNIQARVRMVLAFLFAQLLLWVRGSGARGLLVLGSANVDESLRGYFTKYDNSAADINPIGGVSKRDLKRFLCWAADHLGYRSLRAVVEAPPTAELEPISMQYVQLDEVDMGMTYEELTEYGTLRKQSHCGPVSMFQKLARTWSHQLSPRQVAEKVKLFFRMYAINRHKMTVMTPSYHAENYSPEDNRFDLRQFLYNARWPWQFRRIDALAAEMEAAGGVVDGGVTRTGA